MQPRCVYWFIHTRKFFILFCDIHGQVVGATPWNHGKQGRIWFTQEPLRQLRWGLTVGTYYKISDVGRHGMIEGRETIKESDSGRVCWEGRTSFYVILRYTLAS